MSSLFYSPRHHPRSYSNYHRGQISPYARSGFSASPFGWGVEPFSFNEPFHAPFQSLFNDTFSQLERLTNEMNTHLNGAFAEDSQGQGQNTWQKLLTSTPKSDVKETEDAYVLEGELPGVAKQDISLDFVDDNTLVLKTKTETIREQKPAPQEQGQVEGAADTQMTGANPDAAEGTTKATEATDKDKQVTTTNQNKEVAQAGAQPMYHLTERTYGSFQRVFSFPSEVKHEEVKAKLANGVLTVTVPKVQKTAEPEKKSRTVTVEDVEEGEVQKEEKSKL